MRKYEVCCLFKPDNQEFERGKEAVKKALGELGATVTKEEDMGNRSLAYEVQKFDHGHYYLFEMDMAPEQAFQTKTTFKLIDELLKFLLVRQDD